MRNPSPGVPLKSDMEKYKDILLYTNVHRQGSNPKKQVRGSKSKKYRFTIKPLLTEMTPVIFLPPLPPVDEATIETPPPTRQIQLPSSRLQPLACKPLENIP